MAIQNRTTLLQQITDRLADNNAGNISAADVRENMENIVESMLSIVSKELDTSLPFEKDIQIGSSSTPTTATLTLASGVYFNDATFQSTAYPGPGQINHNDLAGLGDLTADPHPKYLPSDGTRPFTGSLPMQGWINESGVNNAGFNFNYNDGNEIVGVGSNTTIKFDTDNSIVDTAKGVAKAWLNFSASGVSNSVTVHSAYNIAAIKRWKAIPTDPASEGKFTVEFKPGTFDDAKFVAVAVSNGRDDDDQASDFSINTVGMVERGGDGTLLNPHYLSFFVLSAEAVGGTGSPGYVDAPINELVVYGLGSGVVSDDLSGIDQTISP